MRGNGRATTAERGQSLVDYSLILVMVAVVVLIIVAVLGPAIGQLYQQFMDAILPYL
jgi:pilus assembly protein Flp/PilA